MSQVRTRRNVTELSVVSFSDTVNVSVAAASAATKAISTMSNMAFRELVSGSVDIKSTTISETMAGIVKSPVALRNSFAETYTRSMDEITENIDVVTKQKIAIVKTIAQGDYQVLSEKTVETGIQAILKSTRSTELSVAVNTMMNTIQQEHNTVFTQSIAAVVKKASISSGFANVKVKAAGHKVSVIALNENGQSILTDVKIDAKTQRVDLVSETIGIVDKSCDSILNKFDQELEKAGLKYKKPDVKWKETVSWMPDNQAKASIRKTTSEADVKLRSVATKNIKI
jgi:hypothetical protein